MTQIPSQAPRAQSTAGRSSIQSMQETEDATIQRLQDEYQGNLGEGQFHPVYWEPSEEEAFRGFLGHVRNPDASSESVLKHYAWLPSHIQNEVKLRIWENLGSPPTYGENTGFYQLRAHPHSPAVLTAVGQVEAAHPDLLVNEILPVSEKNRVIGGVELLVKSTGAALLGAVPFVVSKTAEHVLKGWAWIAQEGKNFLSRFGIIGIYAGEAFKVSLGVPACVISSYFFVGAWAFSKTQQLIWGKELVEHPQEERVNTKLARYGAGEKLWDDLYTSFVAFFYVGNRQKSDALLTEIRNFQIP